MPAQDWGDSIIFSASMSTPTELAPDHRDRHPLSQHAPEREHVAGKFAVGRKRMVAPPREQIRISRSQ